MLSSTPKLKHATIESCEEARGHVDKHILYTIASPTNQEIKRLHFLDHRNCSLFSEPLGGSNIWQMDLDLDI